MLFFLMYFKDEEKKWIVVIMCEEIKIIKKLKNFNILMEYSVK